MGRDQIGPSTTRQYLIGPAQGVIFLYIISNSPWQVGTGPNTRRLETINTWNDASIIFTDALWGTWSAMIAKDTYKYLWNKRKIPMLPQGIREAVER